MKKIFFYAASLLAIASISFVSCQKEVQDEIAAAAPSIHTEIGERGPTPSNPCAQTTVSEGSLGQKTNSFFRSGWSSGALDTYANGCILDGTYNPDCSAMQTATFMGLPEFTYGNFFSNQNAITPAEQQAIVDAALSFAQQNAGCSGSVHINFIDFVLAPEGGQINFAVKFQCCENGSGNE